MNILKRHNTGITECIYNKNILYTHTTYIQLFIYKLYRGGHNDGD